MELLADGLLLFAAFAAAIYCATLARRMRALAALDSGLGGAIATLSRQVDEMRRSLTEAKAVAGASTTELTGVTRRAEAAAERLELLIAALNERDTPRREPAARRQSAPREASRDTLVRSLRDVAEVMNK
ncbi:MAG: hypothetical protein AAGJ92_11770 [Pseudomonadota bacterium]